MLAFPRKTKHRKWQTNRTNPKKVHVDTRGTTVAFGAFGLKSVGVARIRSNQMEAARRALTRKISKTGKVWVRIFTDRPVTQKAAEVGMGKGKGDPVAYCFEVLPGRVLFEVDGCTEAVAKEALRKAGTKLPVKTKIVARV